MAIHDKWPDSVAVLESRHRLMEPAQAKHHPTRNPYLRAQQEFRDSKYFHQMNTHQTKLMCEIWSYRFNQLYTFHGKYPTTYKLHDVYNAAWAACGYVENQSEKALELADKRFPWTQDGYVSNRNEFAPPRPKPKKKAAKKKTKKKVRNRFTRR